jgi:3-oxoacyl-(acyl-carrier-protein) synthase
MSLFIRDLTCISPQPTFENDFFAGEPIVHAGAQFKASEPSYTGVIPNGILRRMGKSNRLATGAAMPLLTTYKTDGIIIGTTDGGMDDCHRFLDQIIKYEEGTLTPTGFVQGSPNSAAGGLALMSTNDGYNITHSNKGLSFENCILDALMLFKEGEASRLLIGAVEEISKAQFRIEALAGYVKNEEDAASPLFSKNTPGSVAGEGAAMFIVDQKPENAVAEVQDVSMVSNTDLAGVNSTLEALLDRNNLDKDDLDAIMIGKSGDSNTDHYYQSVLNELPSDIGVFTFKNLFGESPSASAFATWFGAQILTGKRVPETALSRSSTKSIKNLLIYNHYQGSQHGFILLRAVK